MRGSRRTPRADGRGPTSRSKLRTVSLFPRSADLAGRRIALSPTIPALFDGPLRAHHRLIGQWVAAREGEPRLHTREGARRHIERTFAAAVRDILAPIDCIDLRTVVLTGSEGTLTAIALVCDSMGQLDLGWIEESDAPISWRAAAYRALERTLGLALPVFGYQDLIEEMACYYWEGETDDEAARHSLVEVLGVDPGELDDHPLPSTMNARRPAWMDNKRAARPSRQPVALRQALETLGEAHRALGAVPDDQNAWAFDFETMLEYMPWTDDCSSLPPLTLVPFDEFARELDDMARHGMEYGFRDVAGLCPLPDAKRIEDWFSSLALGVRFVAAAQSLIRLDPADLGGSHARS